MARDSGRISHPSKIGERQAKTAQCKEQNFSAQEQAGISLDEQTQQALLQGNIEYEQKFGFIFLIKAAGLSSDEILKTPSTSPKQLSY